MQVLYELIDLMKEISENYKHAIRHQILKYGVIIKNPNDSIN